MSRTATRLIVVLGAMLLALPLGACGSKKKKMMDPVMMALETPGIRLVVVPKQRQSLRIVVPPCSAAAVRQSSSKEPPGSNVIVIPARALTQTVGVPPCMMMAPQTSTNTILMAPGGTGMSATEAGMASELVVPTDSNLRTIIVPPCVMGGDKSKKGTKSFAFPATTSKKTVTAPPCTAPPEMKKKK